MTRHPPGGYKFAPLVASRLWRANQHEPACFGLSSPWSFPSRSGIPLHAVVQPWLLLQLSTSPRNVPPLVPSFCAIPPRPGLQSSTGRRWCPKLRGRPGSTRFSLGMENEQTDAGRDCRTRLVRPNSEARTGTGKNTFSLVSWPRAELATLPAWSKLLLYAMTIHTY